jgi:hypothetical protein
VHLRETRSTLGGFAADPAAPWAARTISPPSQCRHVKVVVDPPCGHLLMPQFNWSSVLIATGAFILFG